jgi:hypothetical protein
VPSNVQGCIAYQADRAGNALDSVQALKLPVGWDSQNRPKDIGVLIGWALTIFALSLGAPFWFDLLSKIVRVRSTGAPPPASDAVRRGEGEETRRGPVETVEGGTAEPSPPPAPA